MIDQEAETIQVTARTPDLQRFLDIIISVGEAKDRCSYGDGARPKRTCTSNRVQPGTACNLTAENACWMGHPVIIDLPVTGTNPIMNRPNLRIPDDSGF